MNQPSRLSLALDFACAAMLVLISGQVADAMIATRIVPLEEEFADIFLSGKRVAKRIDLVMAKPEGPFPWRERGRRFFLLRKATVMPSIAVLALAEAFGCDPKSERGPVYGRRRTLVDMVARELNASEAFLRMCWQTNADLDSQWHAYRNELLRIRAEWAERAA
jgi:hypothetical protein